MYQALIFLYNLFKAFLLVTLDALNAFGGNNPYNVKEKGEVYLWFTSLFLSYDFLNFVSNIFFLLIICSPMEAYLGIPKTIIIYLFGGACGSLFGCVT